MSKRTTKRKLSSTADAKTSGTRVLAAIGKRYGQESVRDRIRAFFLDNIGRVATREQIQKVARDPKTGRVPENWHQRLSELRTDEGYTILSWRNRGDLKVSEYLMPTSDRRVAAAKRLKIHHETWLRVLERANYRCEWQESGAVCGLKSGDIDPIGGGTVKLTPDHKRPHAIDPAADPKNLDAWQALCGRHQVVKKNYWDHTTGWLNVYAIVQAAPEAEKRRVYEFLKSYFGDKP
jgi:hypothetical protein